MRIYSLDVLFPDFEPVCCSMSSSNCCFLTCMQVSQETGQVVCYLHLLKNFLQFVVIHTVKGFSIVEAEVDVFLEFSCFFDDPRHVGNLKYGFSKFRWTIAELFRSLICILYLKKKKRIFSASHTCLTMESFSWRTFHVTHFTSRNAPLCRVTTLSESLLSDCLCWFLLLVPRIPFYDKIQ